MKAVLGLVFGFVSCGGAAAAVVDTQARTGAAMAIAVSAVVPALRDLEQKEGDDAIDWASDKMVTHMWISTIEDRWRPIWDAHQALEAAEEAWINTLDRGDNPEVSYQAVVRAFCEFKGLLPRTVALPRVRGIRCEGPASDGG